MNARRYPRTTAEAFKGADYACAIEKPPARNRLGLLTLTAIGVLALIGIACAPDRGSSPPAPRALDPETVHLAASLEADARRRCAAGQADDTGYIAIAGGGIVCSEKRRRGAQEGAQ